MRVDEFIGRGWLLTEPIQPIQPIQPIHGLSPCIIGIVRWIGPAYKSMHKSMHKSMQLIASYTTMSTANLTWPTAASMYHRATLPMYRPRLFNSGLARIDDQEAFEILVHCIPIFHPSDEANVTVRTNNHQCTHINRDA